MENLLRLGGLNGCNPIVWIDFNCGFRRCIPTQDLLHEKRLITIPEDWGNLPASETWFYAWLDVNAELLDIHHYRGKCVKAFLESEYNFKRGVDRIGEDDLRTLQCIFSIWWDMTHKPKNRS